MSQVQVRQALEAALNSVSPAIEYAWENDIYKPTLGTPYGQVFLISGQPLNPEIGVGGFFQETGVFQITLKYPANAGPGNADAQAEVLRAKFYQGAQFTKGSTVVTVTRTPWIGQGRPDGDRWAVPVKVTYVANGSS